MHGLNQLATLLVALLVAWWLLTPATIGTA